MALYRRKGSPFWWSKLYHQGEVVYFSTRERTKVRALRVERDRASELKARARLEGRFSLGTLCAKFILWKAADGRSSDTVAIYKKHLKLHILPFFGAETDVRAIDAIKLEDYKARRGGKVSSSTVAKELSTLRQILRYGAEVHKIMLVAPTVRNPRHQAEPKWRLLTPIELKALLTELLKARGRGRDAFAYFLFMANTGLRGGSIARLTWEMLDDDRTAVRLPARANKQRRTHVVPLNEAAQRALELVRARRRVKVEGARIFPCKHYYGSLRAAYERAKIGRLRPHDLRHTLGSLLHAAGRSGPEIRDILGHTTLTMANHYAHTYQEHLHDAVAAVVIDSTNVTVNVTKVRPNVTGEGDLTPAASSEVKSKLTVVP